MLRALFATTVLAIANASAQDPDPARIMEGTRIATTLQQSDLHGNLSKNGVKTPVHLFLRGKDIQFAYDTGGTTQRFHLRLGDGKYDLFDVGADGKTTVFPAAKLTSPIAGTDLTYEDLSFQFFYWPNPKLEDIESVGGQDCYKIRLNKPAGSGGRYAVVYVWVHTKQGAFMRVRGFDKSGAMLKEFQVDEIMNVGNGVYTLKKMTVSSMAGDRRTGVTTLLFDKPQDAGGPKGLR
ncbi:outer membrane lipoprotein-sorting protein [Luteolibacter ambystomatis]|uniref:Outer membrane lipoprotein-sorting protein n=1 Tax=Luteolibacter ambystomatis TaxID=2824561 RepID=A0A975IZD3_9BACT|nr:outer membrane lipoprotein-sorting protein [Luteolibacter ambystomatis]QUE49575.1 outer membrane lipoprotein-sorting protein [Luteolibacter ambystomatis]